MYSIVFIDYKEWIKNVDKQAMTAMEVLFFPFS